MSGVLIVSVGFTLFLTLCFLSLSLSGCLLLGKAGRRAGFLCSYASVVVIVNVVFSVVAVVVVVNAHVVVVVAVRLLSLLVVPLIFQ